MSNTYCERVPKSGGAWLQLLVSGLVIYILAAGAGLVFIMFPDATRQVFGDIRQAIWQYTPHSSKPRLPVIDPPVVAEKPAIKRPVPRPVHVRPAALPSNGNFGVQIINATQPEPPVRSSQAVTLSIDNDRPAQATNAPVRP